MAESILLIDDETQFLVTMAKRLHKRGFLVREAGSGLEGLQELEVEPADVVVLDVGMPGMDGIQVLREIKLRFPQVQVLMLTGHADMEVAISGMAMGAFDYLMKPVELDVLVGKIREACSRSRKAGERRGLE
ncbi:response regulator [Desulfomicrobium sp. ZS1]|uniref:response regulator n=1 Tax=Desulfomicrobium sp. ZS1 TaxID=2952228 RepID=UPI0020B24976|nr:response regulator [Desulfomicrobium sp. ZS1]UTF49157.1 response regulator [Desulfomicrobium sp. ZS1]